MSCILSRLTVPVTHQGAYVALLFALYVLLQPAGTSPLYEEWALFLAAAYFTVLTATTICRVSDVFQLSAGCC